MTKSICFAYLCYLIGGIFGLHHFYMERDFQVILWLCSFNGCFIGLFYDIFRIPSYVKRANKSEEYILREYGNFDPKQKPPIKIILIIAQIFYAQLFNILFYYLIPPERDFQSLFGIYFPIFEIELNDILEFIRTIIGRLGAVLAIKYVASLSDISGPFQDLFGVMSTINTFSYKHQYLSIFGGVFYFQFKRRFSSIFFEIVSIKNNLLSKQFKIIRLRHTAKSIMRICFTYSFRFLKIALCVFIFQSVIIFEIYLHGSFNIDKDILYSDEMSKDNSENSENNSKTEKIFLRDILTYIIQSKLWKRAKNILSFYSARINKIGFENTVKEIYKELTDQISEKMKARQKDKYYEILGIEYNATNKDIKDAFKKLARKYHPDKDSDGLTKEEQKQYFFKIQEAYEALLPKSARRITNVDKKHQINNITYIFK